MLIRVGVTLDKEYLIVRLNPDGSRRIVDATNMRLVPNYPTWEEIRDFRLGLWDNAPAMFWGEWDSDLARDIRRGAGIQFMPYPPADGLYVPPVDDPPNQIAHLQRIQANAAVSAHDLQVTLGNDILRSATADDYNTVKFTFIHMIGSAWLRYEEWAKVDPEELILGGNNDGLPLWKAGPDGLEAITLA